MSKVEIVYPDDGGDWCQVWLDGKCEWEHHTSINWEQMLIRLGHEVWIYNQPLDEDGQLQGTNHLRDEGERLEYEENPY